LRVLLIVGGGALGLLVLGMIAIAILFDGYRVPSEAMAPALEPGDRVLARDVDGDDVSRGDIVVWRADEPPLQRISRVVAVAADEVGAEGGRLTIDGEPADEPYLADGTTTSNVDPITVPEGHVYLMGDNRSTARDSRLLGPIERDHIERLVVFRWWPIGAVGGL
jgi:signal peptidase I